MDWLSIVLLSAAVLCLGIALYWIWTAAGQPSASGCHNPPHKVIRESQYVGIAISIAGLVAGRVIARPVITLRSELNARLALPHEHQRHMRYALLTQAVLTGALLFISFLVAFESLTLWRGVWPITYYTRCAAEAATWQTYIGAFVLCFLIGRWLWLPKTPK